MLLPFDFLYLPCAPVRHTLTVMSTLDLQTWIDLTLRAKTDSPSETQFRPFAMATPATTEYVSIPVTGASSLDI